MKLYIVIPTYKRVKKLKRCLDSILASDYSDWNVIVVADNQDVDSVVYVHSLKHPKIETMVNTGHKFVIGSWNRFWTECWDREFDGMLGLCDDVELYPNTISEAVISHKKYFQDVDGIVGLKQECPGHEEYTFKWYGQTLIGKKFAERFKEVNHIVHCPDYKHFYQDEELSEFAISLDKFAMSPKAVLKHYHPSFVKEEMDSTHNIIRKGRLSPKKEDINIYEIRRSRNLIWGKSFELINKRNLNE